MNVKFVESLINQHMKREKDNQYYIWSILMWFMWKEYESRVNNINSD